jgi:esterase/lipase
MKATKQSERLEGVSMDVMAMLTGAGISTGVGIIAKVLGFWKESGVTEAQLQERLATMKEELRKTTETMKEETRKTAENVGRTTAEFNDGQKQTVAELRAVVVTVAALQGSQDVTNKFTAQLLDSLAKKAESHDRIINETQGMIGQVLQQLRRNGS